MLCTEKKYPTVTPDSQLNNNQNNLHTHKNVSLGGFTPGLQLFNIKDTMNADISISLKVPSLPDCNYWAINASSFKNILIEGLVRNTPTIKSLCICTEMSFMNVRHSWSPSPPTTNICTRKCIHWRRHFGSATLYQLRRLHVHKKCINSRNGTSDSQFSSNYDIIHAHRNVSLKVRHYWHTISSTRNKVYNLKIHQPRSASLV